MAWCLGCDAFACVAARIQDAIDLARLLIETSAEQQVTLMSEKVVVERRRPVSDRVKGEILTEVPVEVVETEEVPTVT